MSAALKTEQIFAGALDIQYSRSGEGRPYLLLHGGAGAGSMAGLAAALAQDGSAVVPTHPGFDGMLRPLWFSTVEHLALAYLALIDRLDLNDVVLIGNSVGGWIAAEMALKGSPRVSSIVLLNAVGIDTGSAEKSIVDPMVLSPAERAAFAFHDPARFAIAPSGPDAAQAMAENQRTLRIYAGNPFMHDPTLQSRLAGLACPALVVWGESDRIVDVDYGRRYAASMAGARLEFVAQAAHFPQIEQREEVVRLIRGFLSGASVRR